MTKRQIINLFHDFLIKRNHEISKTEVNILYNEMFKFISEEIIQKGKSMRIENFGTFYVGVRNEGTFYHPVTREKIEKGKRSVPMFTYAENLRNHIMKTISPDKRH